MKVEAWIFGALAIFFAIVTPIYWFMSNDPTGTAALIMSFLLVLMIAAYLGLVARRIDPRPEDRPDADVADGAGEVGFFSPGSYWPFGLALAASVAGVGMVFWQWWLIAAGMIAVLLASCGLLFEYYTGTRRTH